MEPLEFEPRSMTADDARDQVWKTIHSITDPELDESIVDLGFIQSLAISQPPLASSNQNRFDVQLRFRLPTYWCAANFAFIMAEDLRERIAQLPWVNEIRVELADHFTASEINTGLATGKSFSESFPDEGGGDLKDLRRLFRLKAFQRRQYRLLRHLIDTSGDTPDARGEILAMTVSRLRDLPITDDGAAKLRHAYLEILPEFLRPPRSASSSEPSFSSSLAFIQPNGSPLDADHLDDHLRQLRCTTTNIEFNAAICSSLLKARNTQPS
jgi:metal-sulfur cluster biosynthetic enzyme